MAELPISLNRVGEEVLLALSADTTEGEHEHRALAEALMAQVMHDIENERRERQDWSLLGA